eukprot:GDKI01020039.1.p1 GENE.GDKI01020039.1~~GDKI01020039.1.p1  ORF type:complete len:680 (+),score=234.20 GDKI01020039.1:38-2041(+)
MELYQKEQEDIAAAAAAAEEEALNKLYIYFGSQTGTAESFAKTLGQQAEEKGVPVEVMDLEDFDSEVLKKQRWVVMVLATYGEGDPTDNAVKFHKWCMNKEREQGELSGMKFAIMGLGNRQYINFNEMARKVDRAFTKMGGVNICRRGEGDDDQDIEADFNKWATQDFWPAFVKANTEGGAEGGEAAATTAAPKEKWSKRAPLSIQMAPDFDSLIDIAPATRKRSESFSNRVNIGTDVNARFYFAAHTARVAVDMELRQLPVKEEGLSTHHVEIDVSACANLTYVTADNLDILPENPESTVLWFTERLGLKPHQLDSFVHFVKREGVDDNGKRPFPTPCTLRDALVFYTELNVVPPKSALKELTMFLQDPREKAALESLLSEEGAADFKSCIKDVEMTYREFIEIFMTSAVFDLAAFLQITPRQRPRAYTISSSSHEHPQQIAVTVSVVHKKQTQLHSALEQLSNNGRLSVVLGSEMKKEIGERERNFNGLTSSWLCNSLRPNHRVKVAVKASTFRLPEDPTTPVIMVGAGTGLAPFRAFWREFQSVGGERETALFFGSTSQHKDWIYKDEMLAAHERGSKGGITHLHTAFSRDQAQKIYVQHRVLEQGELVGRLLAQGGYFYICGATKMGRDVEAAIAEIGSKYMNDSGIVEKLKQEKRLIQELWA